MQISICKTIWWIQANSFHNDVEGESTSRRLKLASVGRLVIHAILLVYAAILAYVLLGLVFGFDIQAEVFFDLSFALLFFTLGQCIYELGPRKAIFFLAITSTAGLLAEILGTSTGFPFGKYYYTDFLGPKIMGVPEVVPLVWFVIAYLTFSMAKNLSWASSLSRKTMLKIASLSAFGAVSWDFMVDPMFSSYGYWVWTGQYFRLPELDHIPLTNFIGWFLLVTLMLMTYLLLSKSKTSLSLRKNTLDSQLAYLFLLLDGTIANWELGNYTIIVLGSLTMLSFVAISYYTGIQEPSQVIK